MKLHASVTKAYSFIARLPDLTIVPWQKKITFDPINHILNAPDESKDAKIAAWKDAKLGELLFVGLTVWSSPRAAIHKVILTKSNRAH